MFNDLTIARKNAFGLAKNLMVITMVIAIGAQYAVITAEDHDNSLSVVAEFYPFA